MSIRERRPGVWQIRAYAGINEAGRSKYVYRTFFGSKSEARKEEIRLKAAAGALPQNVAERSWTFGQYFERWMNLYVLPTAAPSTVDNYRFVYKKMLEPGLGAVKLSELNADIVQRVFNELLLTYSQTTVVKARSILSACLKRARQHPALISHNPVEALAMPKARKHLVKVFTGNELNRFIEAARHQLHGPMFITAALTGMRRLELLALSWSNVDLVAGVIHVREGGSRPGTTKSEAGQRDIFIPAVLKQVLTEVRIEDAKKQNWTPDSLVFPSSRTGGQLNKDTSFAPALERILKVAKIERKGFRLHDLRHAYGSLLVNSGIPISDVSEKMGHASVQTTVQMYVHQDGEGGSRIVKCLDDLTGMKAL